VYEVPVASPSTMAVSGTGEPLTVTTCVIVDPVKTVTV
jgi:hypothetical protein